MSANSEAIHKSEEGTYSKELYNTDNRKWADRFRVPVNSDCDAMVGSVPRKKISIINFSEYALL